MSNYTRGPWVAQGNKVYAMSDCVHHPVASTECNHTCRDEFDQEANARLIAAAPDLLEALKELKAQVETFCAQFGEADFETGRATAAIKKAEEA